MERRRSSEYQHFTFRFLCLMVCQQTFGYSRDADIPYENSGIKVFSDPLAESYSVLYVENEYLYIGAVHTPQVDGPGYVFKVRTSDISESIAKATFAVKDDTSTGVIHCRQISTINREIECRNFIKVIIDDPNTNEELLVCGTNAQWSRCYHVHKSSLLQDGADFSGSSKCPNKQSETVTASFGQDNKLYTALIRDQSKPAIIRSQNSLSSTELQTEDDPKWLKEAEFISSHSVNRDDGTDEVLFFFRETANENENQYPQELTYSRVAKVCEVDKGGNTNVLSDRWSSYLKARLDCSFTSTDEHSNFYEQFYDVLEDTMVVGDIVYAVFSANRNGVIMPALCTYNVKNMPSIFDDGTYWTQSNAGRVWSEVVPSLSPKPGECVDDSTSLPDDVLNALKAHPLTAKLIPSQQPPLLTSFIGVRFKQVVSTEVGSQLILYICTDKGTVMKVLYNDGSPYVLDVVRVSEENTAVPMVITKSDADNSLYIGFNDKVVQVPMYQCHRYTDCSQCNGAGDPHCAWNANSGQCVFDTSPKSACTTAEPVKKKVSLNEKVMVICAVRNVEWTVDSANIQTDGLKYITVDGIGLVITDFQEADAGRYKARHRATSIVTCSMDLWVTESFGELNFLAPKLEEQSKATCQGRILNLFCNADGPPGFTTTWKKPDGSVVRNESRVQWANVVECENFRRGISWLAVEVSADSTGIYTCEISDGITTKTAEAEISLQECVTQTSIACQNTRHDEAEARYDRLSQHMTCPATQASSMSEDICTCRVEILDCSDCCSEDDTCPAN
ncbi:semaphorin-1A-like [Ptychodera flava]|uniref:semaphorin-1A-like n=1 Tax=Ptychodera flava TaxID=63121 RepID=UPI003969BD60